MSSIKTPRFKDEPLVKRMTKRILKYPRGIYMLSVGKLIPESWKQSGEIVVDVEVLESSSDYVVLKITRKEAIELTR